MTNLRHHRDEVSCAAKMTIGPHSLSRNFLLCSRNCTARLRSPVPKEAMRRRDFHSRIWRIGGGVAARGARAAADNAVIGFFAAASLGSLRQQIAAFHAGLKEAGYVENQNVAIEYRSAEGQINRAPTLIGDLVRRQVAVLVAARLPRRLPQSRPAQRYRLSSVSALIPSSPAWSLASTDGGGGNLTGIYMFITGLEAKRLGLTARDGAKAKTIAVLINPDFLSSENSATRRAGCGGSPSACNRYSTRERGKAISTLRSRRCSSSGLRTPGQFSNPFFNSRREQLVVLAARHAVPAIYDCATSRCRRSYELRHQPCEAYRQAWRLRRSGS